MYCKNCGAKLGGDAKFCGSCGKAVVQDTSTPQEVAVPKELSKVQNPFPHGGRIEGWLTLIGLGLLVAGIEFLVALFSGQGSAADVINIILLASIIYVSYLFFKKDRRFPRYFIIYLCALVVLSIFAGMGTNWQDSSTWVDPILAAIIWIPYTLVSKRVKATFVY